MLHHHPPVRAGAHTAKRNARVWWASCRTVGETASCRMIATAGRGSTRGQQQTARRERLSARANGTRSSIGEVPGGRASCDR
eukprot:768344-Hanusia_phi.AAC.12